MKDRLKLLRKTLGLNQVDFGARVGIGGTAISKFENGTNAISDSLVLLVCREFNVNENWLRNGNGEMFSRQSTDLIEQLTQPWSVWAAAACHLSAAFRCRQARCGAFCIAAYRQCPAGRGCANRS